MPEIKSVVNIRFRDCNILFYDMKYISKQPTSDFIRLFCVLEKVTADKWLNETRLSGTLNVTLPCRDYTCALSHYFLTTQLFSLSPSSLYIYQETVTPIGKGFYRRDKCVNQT